MSPCWHDVAKAIARAALEPKLRPEATPPAAPPGSGRHDQRVWGPGHCQVLGCQRDLGFLPSPQHAYQIVLGFAVADPEHSGNPALPEHLRRRKILRKHLPAIVEHAGPQG